MAVNGDVLDGNGNVVAAGVDITSINCNGCNVYITYVESGDLKVVRSFISSASAVLATNCTVS